MYLGFGISSNFMMVLSSGNKNRPSNHNNKTKVTKVLKILLYKISYLNLGQPKGIKAKNNPTTMSCKMLLYYLSKSIPCASG